MRLAGPGGDRSLDEYRSLAITPKWQPEALRAGHSSLRDQAGLTVECGAWRGMRAMPAAEDTPAGFMHCRDVAYARVPALSGEEMTARELLCPRSRGRLIDRSFHFTRFSMQWPARL